MPSMQHVIYASVAAQDFGAAQLTELLQKARAANEHLGLSFFQRKVPGLNDFFHGSSCFTGLDAGRAKKLLATFAEGRWRPKHRDAKCTAA